ncbi:MAG: SGNH/GDSL hydrolase family protein [Ruminococcaceae bacterium]|nr:SGNH/GDSL hydrolase family protein [Oscillospiraceae bacterium]
MDLKDLRAAFLGDSITEGVGASSRENSYPAILAANTGIKSLNYGLSGTRIARQKKTYGNHVEWDRNFISRVDEIADDAKVIVVCGSINDYMHGDAELGCFDDRNEYSFFGAMHILLDRLIKRFPEAHIVFMTPPRFVGDLSPEYAYINKGHKFSEYLRAVKEVCDHYSVPVFDLYLESGLDSNITELRERFYSDGVHLNDNGYKRVAEKLEEFLRKLPCKEK